MNLFKYYIFIAQLCLLPLFLVINPAAAELIKDDSQTTETNLIQNVSSRHEVSISAKDLLLTPKDICEASSPCGTPTDTLKTATGKDLSLMQSTANSDGRWSKNLRFDSILPNIYNNPRL